VINNPAETLSEGDVVRIGSAAAAGQNPDDKAASANK
jgi:hypothetical protein